jgi:CDP-diacylglycerol--glycerol-3-phosphate 3-phosphatidyltransferase
MATSLGETQPVARPTRERFWNLPNTITVVRLAVIPVLIGFPHYAGRSGSHVVAWLFILSAIGDLVDGWAARRGKMVTSIGKLLDPLADKLTVATALIVLMLMERIPYWGLTLVVVIIGRELAVTGLRGIASAGGHVVAATWAGKLKTLSQNVALGFLIFPAGTLGIPNHPIGVSLLTLAAALTLWSGWVYFADYFRSDPGQTTGGPPA